jgi:hypothetical protein
MRDAKANQVADVDIGVFRQAHVRVLIVDPHDREVAGQAQREDSCKRVPRLWTSA